MVYWEALGSHPATVLLKYAGQALRTWRILARERPAQVFVMAPPVAAAVAVLPYCLLRSAPLVVDAHTGAFLNPMWRRVQWLQRWVCRRARTTIVTNDHLRSLVESFGGHAVIARDVPVAFPDAPPPPFAGPSNVAVVCSFGTDEPIGAIFDAARSLPDVAFHMTGNPARLDADLRSRCPDNVRLTGFLSDGDYGRLLADADAVVTLTTQDHTMLRGAWEAAYLATPVVVSDWPLLREAFAQGAVHVDNSPSAIGEGVRRVLAELPRYRAEARALRDEKRARWETTKAAILDRLG